MALTNYSAFTATVESYLARNDLTSVIPDFVQMAQLRMSRDLRTERMLKVATTSPSDNKVAFLMMSSVATRLITCLYLTLGIIVIPPLSRVGADNKAAAMYLPANSPA